MPATTSRTCSAVGVVQCASRLTLPPTHFVALASQSALCSTLLGWVGQTMRADRHRAGRAGQTSSQRQAPSGMTSPPHPHPAPCKVPRFARTSYTTPPPCVYLHACCGPPEPQVEAEKYVEVCQGNNIVAVPSVLLFKVRVCSSTATSVAWILVLGPAPVQRQ